MTSPPARQDWRSFGIREILPHSSGMVFLDRVLDYQPDSITTEAVIRPENPFYVQGRGIPVCIGFEYMAQTMAAFSGIAARLDDTPVKLGVLVGCRKASCGQAWFTENQVIRIRADLEWDTEGMGVFESSIMDSTSGNMLLEGKINVYQPDDLESYLEQATSR